MNNLWLAERSGWGPRTPIGLFSKPERAREICQDVANEYFGARNTPALRWQGDDSYSHAAHHDPNTGMLLFQIIRLTVDEVLQS